MAIWGPYEGLKCVFEHIWSWATGEFITCMVGDSAMGTVHLSLMVLLTE